jgi:hypothetical protein
VVAYRLSVDHSTDAEPLFGSSAVVGSYVAPGEAASRRKARTRGFAPPAFAGFAFVDGRFIYRDIFYASNLLTLRSDEATRVNPSASQARFREWST